MTDAAELWILSDGRAGNVAQARGLAEAMARLATLTLVDKPVVLKRWAAMVPVEVYCRLGARRGGWPFSGLDDGGRTLRPPWPHALIAAGRRAAPIAAAIRRLHGVAAVQLLAPKMPVAAFDAVVAPEHDGLTGANVLTSVGALNRLTRRTISEAAAAWPGPPQALARPRLAVMVGGPSKSVRFGANDARDLMQALETLSTDHGLMITSSRRTDPAFAEELRARLGSRAAVWTGLQDGPNPYPAFLAHADAVLVTEDSVNMASEAATAGLPVHVFPISGVAGKIARFHESLAARGASRRFAGSIERWDYEPLAEADRIAGELARGGLLGSWFATASPR